MTRAEVQQEIAAALTAVAPEIDFAALDAAAALRDQVDLDSMDFLRFIVDLHARTHVEIPEADYSRLTTIDAIADYIASHGRAG